MNMISFSRPRATKTLTRSSTFRARTAHPKMCQKHASPYLSVHTVSWQKVALITGITSEGDATVGQHPTAVRALGCDFCFGTRVTTAVPSSQPLADLLAQQQWYGLPHKWLPLHRPPPPDPDPNPEYNTSVERQLRIGQAGAGGADGTVGSLIQGQENRRYVQLHAPGVG